MFEALVERLLNKILGEYVENFSAENLKIGIWSGEVVLKNIALKRSIIRKLNLPFRVNYSRLGTLRMNIPWKSLTSSKIEVLLEGLELVVSELPIGEWDCRDSRIIEKRKQQLQAVCEAVLADFARRADQGKEKGEDGYFSKLVVKIIDNLQVTVRDIHIRYEDELSKTYPAPHPASPSASRSRSSSSTPLTPRETPSTSTAAAPSTPRNRCASGCSCPTSESTGTSGRSFSMRGTTRRGWGARSRGAGSRARRRTTT